jgi:hypothetical protein
MRLWSLHPAYLDAKGLVALWREALLAQAVLGGKTQGYRHHPQLERFRATRSPLGAIAAYLREVRREALRRGYRFDAAKIARARTRERIAVSRGQLSFERRHLAAKLRKREPARLAALARAGTPRAHPLFRVIAGGVAPWERKARPVRRAGRR